MSKLILLVVAIVIASVLMTGCTTNNTAQAAEPVTTPAVTEPANVPTGEETIPTTSEPTTTPDDMRSILIDSMKKIAPHFDAYGDNLITDDYKKLASDTLLFRKEVHAQQDYFGDTIGTSHIPGVKNFSNNDKILYSKYVGYLDTLNNMIIKTQYSLSEINDDNNELTADEKTMYLWPAIQARTRAYDQIDAIFETCEDIRCDCEENDPTVALLKKNLF